MCPQLTSKSPCHFTSKLLLDVGKSSITSCAGLFEQLLSSLHLLPSSLSGNIPRPPLNGAVCRFKYNPKNKDLSLSLSKGKPSDLVHRAKIKMEPLACQLPTRTRTHRAGTEKPMQTHQVVSRS
ncbi:hypothetical protein AOLI_G00311880 [Acnodon oligacanthus]